MKTGKILFYNPFKKYGFILIDGTTDTNIFFHESGLEENIDVYKDDHVSFEETKNQKGPVAVKIKLLVEKQQSLSTEVDPEIAIQNFEREEEDENEPESETGTEINNELSYKIIKSISENWKLEAKLETQKDYFYHFHEVNNILNKTKYYIIGRKGSGKSSISEYILNRKQFNHFSEKLSFKNFPFNELYHLDNQKYTPPNQYITLWKYLIYSTVAKLMVGNERIDVEIRSKLKKLYKPDPIRSLARTINSWTSAEFGADILGTGAKIKVSKENLTQPANWIQRVTALEDLLLDNCDDSDYFIIFDELDEDYGSIKLSEHILYKYLLTSLFKAVQDIKSFFRSTNINICPIIFLRDDIYSLIQDADKNKWRDFKIEIEWNVEKLKKLLAYRITKDAESDEIFEFDYAWELIFANNTIGAGTRKSKEMSSFDYITRSTHLRPRDYIRYFQVCCENTLALNRRKISNQTIRFVDRAFSNYLKDEIVDELSPLLPEINEIFQIISNIRKQSFSVDEFRNEYNKYLKSNSISEENFDYVVDVLFKFSVLGNQNKHKPEVLYFKYMQTNMNVNKNEHLVVHRGLFKALQIL